MYSIYHFFKNIFEQKTLFRQIRKLEEFPFDADILSCRNKGVFPDMAIRLNQNGELFTGGELIELKDSRSYTVSSFNSTIPTGRKSISGIIPSENSIIHKQMEKAGNNIYSLPIREVFYLIRGRQKSNTKVCLVHGSFFETIESRRLIQQAFSQVLEEKAQDIEENITDDTKIRILELLSEQESFSKTRHIQNSSVKIRFRIMTEVEKEGNILDSEEYPQLKDNTLNFLLPCDNSETEQDILLKMSSVFDSNTLNSFDIFQIKHHLNGYFWACGTEL